MTSKSPRMMLFNVHKWLGLNIAIYFFFIFLSGTLLVFSNQIEAIYTPKIWASAPDADQRATFAEIYSSISAALPGSVITEIELRPESGLADRSQVVTPDIKRIVVWTDPTTAEVREITSPKNFHDFIREFHANLWLPSGRGYPYVSATSLLLLTLLISGMVTYRRFWKGLFRLPSKGARGREFWGMTHRLIAVWCLPFMALVVLSSLFFLATSAGFPGQWPSMPHASERADVRPPNFDAGIITAAQEVAVADYPALDPTLVRLPTTVEGGIEFAGPNGASRFVHETTVSVDPVTLAVQGVLTPADFGGNAALEPLAFAVHFGTWGGVPSRFLWALFGVGATLLAFVGGAIYASRIAQTTDASRIGTFVRGLGVMKWAYLAFFLGVGAMMMRWIL